MCKENVSLVRIKGRAMLWLRYWLVLDWCLWKYLLRFSLCLQRGTIFLLVTFPIPVIKYLNKRDKVGILTHSMLRKSWSQVLETDNHIHRQEAQSWSPSSSFQDSPLESGEWTWEGFKGRQLDKMREKKERRKWCNYISLKTLSILINKRSFLQS